MRKLVLVVFSLMAMSISAMNPVEGQENGKTAQADCCSLIPYHFTFHILISQRSISASIQRDASSNPFSFSSPEKISAQRRTKLFML